MCLKSIISLAAFLCLTNMLLSQNYVFGLSGSIGLSKIDYDLEALKNRKDKLILSSNFGFLIEKKIKHKFGIGAKLLWVSLKGETEVSLIELYQINPQTLARERIGVRTATTTFQSNYIGVPIYYLYSTNNLKLNAGIQTMFLINTSSRFQDDILLDGEPPRRLSEGENEFEFNKIDLGATVGISYELSQKLSLTSSFYYGLLNVDKESDNSEKRNRQITLGLNYYLHSF